jgi:hypothetical protein
MIDIVACANTSKNGTHVTVSTVLKWQNFA